MNIEPAERLPQDNPAVKKKKKRWLLAAAAGLAAAAIAAGGLWYQGRLPMGPAAGMLCPARIGHFIPVKEFQVNLAGAGGRRYLRLKIYFGSGDRSVGKEVARREPEIRSAIIEILRCTTVDDLEGQAGMDRLKAGILEQVNSILPQGGVDQVYFDNLLIQ